MAIKNKYQVVLSTEASDMLTGHVAFLANVNARAANLLKNDLLFRIKGLKQTPYLYPIFPSDKLQFEFRKIVYKRYMILYTIEETEKIVRVLYVWDTRMNNEIL